VAVRRAFKLAIPPSLCGEDFTGAKNSNMESAEEAFQAGVARLSEDLATGLSVGLGSLLDAKHPPVSPGYRR
jgi:hypothetical protein